jgi:hypothetical protein
MKAVAAAISWAVDGDGGFMGKFKERWKRCWTDGGCGPRGEGAMTALPLFDRHLPVTL